MASNTTKLIIVLIVGLIVGAVPAYYYGTTTVAPSDGMTTVTRTTTQTVTGGATTVTQTMTNTQTTTQTVTQTGPPPGPPVQIVIDIYGGPIGDFYTKSGIIERFEEMYNAEVIVEFGYGANTRVMVETTPNDPPFDVVMIDAADSIILGDQGLLVPLTDLPVYPKIYEKAIIGNDYGFAILPWFLGIGYNTENISPEESPKEWEDFWDPQWEGKIGLVQLPHSFGIQILVAAAELQGGDQYNMDPGFEYMKEMKPNVIQLQTSTFPLTTALSTGEVWIAPVSYGTYLSYKAVGAPIGFNIPTEHTYYMATSMSVVANRPPESTEMALKFVEYIFSEDIQGLFNYWTSWLPANSETVLSPGIMAMGITPEIVFAFPELDWQHSADSLEEWTQKFSEAWGS
jgi:putative spermidine/putrescine transport system substrate-binding protein